MKKLTLLLVVAMFMMATSAMATPFSGELWSSNASAQNPAAGPAGILLGSFTVDKINFDTRTYGTDYDSWLQGSATNMNGLTWTSPIPVGFISSNTTGTFMQITGTGYFGANTLVTHDDGFSLSMANSVNTYYIDHSTPVSPTNDYLGNVAGVYDFTLNYGAWNGFPETLIANNVAPVPEPGTMMLLGAGMLSLLVFGRRRMNNKA